MAAYTLFGVSGSLVGLTDMALQVDISPCDSTCVTNKVRIIQIWTALGSPGTGGAWSLEHNGQAKLNVPQDTLLHFAYTITQKPLSVGSLYVNGALRNSLTSTTTTGLAAFDRIVVGRSGDLIRGFVGALGDLRVYRKALSLAEMGLLYPYKMYEYNCWCLFGPDQVFQTPGTTQFTLPANVRYEIIVIGRGYGGRGSLAASRGGGGGGAVEYSLSTGTTPCTCIVFTITVGVEGAGGVSSGTILNRGVTVVQGNDGTSYTETGGGAGATGLYTDVVGGAGACGGGGAKTGGTAALGSRRGNRGIATGAPTYAGGGGGGMSIVSGNVKEPKYVSDPMVSPHNPFSAWGNEPLLEVLEIPVSLLIAVRRTQRRALLEYESEQDVDVLQDTDAVVKEEQESVSRRSRRHSLGELKRVLGN